jgi:hypothetical protein
MKKVTDKLFDKHRAQVVDWALAEAADKVRVAVMLGVPPEQLREACLKAIEMEMVRKVQED